MPPLVLVMVSPFLSLVTVSWNIYELCDFLQRNNSLHHWFHLRFSNHFVFTSWMSLIQSSFWILWFCCGILLLVWERKLKHYLPAFLFFRPMYVLGKSHLNSIAPAVPNSVVITRMYPLSHNLHCDFFCDQYLLWKCLSSFSSHWELFIYFPAVVIQPNFAETRDKVCYKIPSFKTCVGLTCIPANW